MRLYPDAPARRTATIAADVALVLALLLFAWLGLKVHDGVDELAALGRGVQDAGSSVQSGFSAAADAVKDVPVIGGTLEGGLRDAGKGSGGKIVEAGRDGERGVHRLANLLGLLTWLIPSGLLLSRVLPPRVAQIRRLSSAARALADPEDPGRRRLIAMRAAFSLPYGQLLRHTRDPIGDLQAERYDALVSAALDDVGLREERAA